MNDENRQDKKRVLTLYIVLRVSVLLTLAIQLLRGNYENVFMCVLTLILFMIPSIIDRRFNIKLPNALEIIILLFIFSAEILGEVQNFYGIFKYWDTMLHTINGFLCAAIGFSFIDILNNSKQSYFKLSPIFVALVAFCFSMTVGVLWEFFEFAMDSFFEYDMQKDRIVKKISSVELNEIRENVPIIIKDIDHSVIYSLENGEIKETVIEGGYLDLGIIDTMKDLLVNFVGAVVFSFLGILYIKDRDKYRFAEDFMPIMKTEEEIEETKRELERLREVLNKKKSKKEIK